MVNISHSTDTPAYISRIFILIKITINMLAMIILSAINLYWFYYGLYVSISLINERGILLDVLRFLVLALSLFQDISINNEWFRLERVRINIKWQWYDTLLVIIM